MNKTPSDAVALVEQLKDKIDTDDVDVVLCVPFVSLAGVGNAIKVQVLNLVHRICTLKTVVLTQEKFQVLC